MHPFEIKLELDSLIVLLNAEVSTALSNDGKVDENELRPITASFLQGYPQPWKKLLSPFRCKEFALSCLPLTSKSDKC